MHELHLSRKPRVTSSLKTFAVVVVVFVTQRQTFSLSICLLVFDHSFDQKILKSLIKAWIKSSSAPHDTSLLPIIISVTSSCNSSRNSSCGASPMRRGDDDRYPSSPPRASRVRMHTPSAAVKKSAAKSDSSPRGRTMIRSSSRSASPQAAVYVWSDADNL